MKTYLIVDGYNVIHHVHKDKSTINLEEAREHLIQQLGNYSGYMGYETLLVFDAYAQDDPESREIQRGNIRVVFTGKDLTADSYIERTVYEMPKLVRVIVVTSDYTLQQVVLAMGGERLSSRELLEGMAETREKLPRHVIKEEGNHRNRISEHMDEDVWTVLEKNAAGRWRMAN